LGYLAKTKAILFTMQWYLVYYNKIR